jgi:putative transposase
MNTKTNSLILEPKKFVSYLGRKYQITHIVDFEIVLAKNCETGKTESLAIKDLQPFNQSGEQKSGSTQETELSLIPEKNWAEARRRYEIIFPLITGDYRRTKLEVKIYAQKYGVHTATLYRWIKMYEETEEVSSLLPNKGGSPRGRSKLLPEVEEIVDIAIKTIYLKKHRKSVKSTLKEIERLCCAAGNLPVPSEKTVRRKIDLITEREKTARRHSSKRARENFDPILGEFPHADYPLAVIQIDHTKVDLIIVDEFDRKPIGRSHITLAIDVFSRIIFGYSISLDDPSNLSVGLCLTHGILPKETWLEKIGVKGTWTSWGFPKTIHADNAGEFRGSTLQRACDQYGINLEWRPIGKPHYGGHIERLMGTFGTEIHELPSTTFSNIQERKDYDSEKEAAMTLRELEKWLTTFIIGEYHERFHEGINTTPMAKWREGLLGTDETPATGLPPRLADDGKLLLDFLPPINRTVQQSGVQIDEIFYNHDILRRYVHAKDDKNRKLKKQFIFKRDPRDISEIYFYEPELKQYFVIPYRDTSRPAISLWEMRKIKRDLIRQGRKKVNEAMIFETRQDLRKQEETAIKLTKSMRREKENRFLHQTNKIKVKNPLDKIKTMPAVGENEPFKRRVILPFDEIEEL